ncbi:hypothetical protein A2U01_0010729 [Trifolium medium]|uniref:Uncharacterized protein n=1 Tax=Trifolium medium TaxID=97028 RepID=A0A392MQQ0_9FABA|nr:hypothetical protein [Trifolium medium]
MSTFSGSSSAIEIIAYLASMSTNSHTLSSHTLHPCQPMPVCHLNNFMPRTPCLTMIASTLPSNFSSITPLQHLHNITLLRIVISHQTKSSDTICWRVRGSSGETMGSILQNHKRGRHNIEFPHPIVDRIPGSTPALPPSRATALIPLFGNNSAEEEK